MKGLFFILTVIMAACSSAQASPTTVVPDPSVVCSGSILGGDGQRAHLELRDSGGVVTLLASTSSRLKVAPNNLRLDSTSPSGRMTITQAGYRGAFTVAFVDCPVTLVDVRLKPADAYGPVVTAIFTLAQ